MRLFTAVVPPVEVRADLQEVAPVAGLRATDPAGWHVTLAFLGEADPETLRDGLARVAAGHPPLDLALSGAGSFGNRVLWAGLSGDLDGLAALAGAVAEVARAAGLTLDDRPYGPHLTLGFAAPPRPLDAEVAALRDHRGPGWRARTLHLVRSDLGPRYSGVATWPLTGP
ncbi:RNA 2',3'-cyclic phosphodiesterase [Pseudonocardia ailaonensis]|uniref:RNA 2',3'-cyclic phosphodiesterase n=1 Tax=Pseudonocardia ailaonensis TaxID=367279 RepID=A0ABN2MUB5_9PSEU